MHGNVLNMKRTIWSVMNKHTGSWSTIVGVSGRTMGKVEVLVGETPPRPEDSSRCQGAKPHRNTGQASP